MTKYSGGQFFDITTYSYGYVTPTAVSVVGVAGRSLAELEDTAGTLMLVEDGRQDAGLGAETQGRLNRPQRVAVKLTRCRVDAVLALRPGSERTARIWEVLHRRRRLLSTS